MSRLKRRPAMPSLFDLITPTRVEGRPTEAAEALEKEKTVAVASEKIPVAVRQILIPKPWPDSETIIQVPAKINWMRPINEFEYEAGITFQGSYPYNSDCSSVWKLKKIGERFIPICDLLNNY